MLQNIHFFLECVVVEPKPLKHKWCRQIKAFLWTVLTPTHPLEKTVISGDSRQDDCTKCFKTTDNFKEEKRKKERIIQMSNSFRQLK